MLKKLKNRFILINMLLVGIVVLLIVLSITLLFYNQQIRLARDSVRGMEKMDFLNPPFANGDSAPNPPMTRIYTINAIVGTNGEISWVQSYIGGYSEEYLKEIINKIIALPKNEGRAYGMIFSKHTSKLGYSITLAPLSSIYQETRSTFFIALGVALVAMGIFYLITRRLASYVIKPTERAWQDQKRFIQDASHDLKTPLTVIMANNDILLSHKESTIKEQENWLKSTEAECSHMKTLIDKMLELAKSESLKTVIQLSNTNISELTQKTILQFEPVAYENQVEIVSTIVPDISISSNADEFTRLLYILIDNAIKYAPKNTKITVLLGHTKKCVRLDVINKGEPIPREHLEHIFDRFYRIDNARTVSGFGLGLSIAKNITHALNGEIFAFSDQENGTTLSVRFK